MRAPGASDVCRCPASLPDPLSIPGLCCWFRPHAQESVAALLGDAQRAATQFADAVQGQVQLVLADLQKAAPAPSPTGGGGASEL
jgi:hypothetical protein